MKTCYRLVTQLYDDGRITSKFSTVEIEGERPKTMSTYYKLLNNFYANGRMTAKISTEDMEDERPEAFCIKTVLYDTYEEYFDTFSEALRALAGLVEAYTIV